MFLFINFLMRVFIADVNGCAYPDMGYQIKDAFELLGHEVSVFNYRKWKLQYFPLTNKLLNKLMILKAKNSDLVLVHKGESILPGTINKIKNEGAKAVAWNLDEPFGHLVPFNKIKNIEEYDAYFTYDTQYVKPLKEINQNTFHLPAAADPFGVHKEQIKLEKRKFPKDICLVGTAYENRVNLIKPYMNAKLNLAGPWWEKTEKRLATQALPRVSMTKMINMFNESKIVLNPYGADKQFICPNPRTFEIPASRSFQLTDMPREVKDYFKPKKEIVVYRDEKELKELIEYYLENNEERNKIAGAGFKKVVKEHTMKHRIKEMLKKLH